MWCSRADHSSKVFALQRRAVLLALVATLAFGTVFALIVEASTTVTGLFLALFVQRATNVVAGGAALGDSVRRGSPALSTPASPTNNRPGSTKEQV